MKPRFRWFAAFAMGAATVLWPSVSPAHVKGPFDPDDQNGVPQNEAVSVNRDGRGGAAALTLAMNVSSWNKASPEKRAAAAKKLAAVKKKKLAAAKKKLAKRKRKFAEAKEKTAAAKKTAAPGTGK